MTKSLLTNNQIRFLEFFNKSKSLFTTFYFSGGTCLSEFYLQHRFSEDLDFFCENEFDIQSIAAILKSNKLVLGYEKIDYINSFNRNIYQLIYKNDETLKVEFTYYPFKRIDISNNIKNIQLDSLLDIAVNKLFTIMQNPRGRDYYDLFFIIKRNHVAVDELIKLARNKFDFEINYLQLGTNLNRVDDFLGDPILLKAVDKNEISSFFKSESKRLKNNIF